MESPYKDMNTWPHMYACLCAYTLQLGIATICILLNVAKRKGTTKPFQHFQDLNIPLPEMMHIQLQTVLFKFWHKPNPEEAVHLFPIVPAVCCSAGITFHTFPFY